jgi:hypothetical protein
MLAASSPPESVWPTIMTFSAPSSLRTPEISFNVSYFVRVIAPGFPD